MKSRILNLCRCTVFLIGIMAFPSFHANGESLEEPLHTIIGDIQQGLKELSRTLQLHLLASLGLLQAKSENIFAAKTTFNEALGILPLHDQEILYKDLIWTNRYLNYLLIIFRNQNMAGDLSGGDWSMNKAKEICKRGYGNLQTFPNCYAEIAFAHAQVRDQPGFQESLHELKRTITTDEGKVTKSKQGSTLQLNLINLATALLNLGEKSRAQAILEEILEFKGQPTFWSRDISVLLAKFGQEELAWSLFKQRLPESGYAKFHEVSALCQLAEGFRVGGNMDEARHILLDAFSLLNRLRKEKFEFRAEGIDKVENFEDTWFFHFEGLVPLGKLQAHLGEFAAAEPTLAQTQQDLQDWILYAILETQLERGETLASRKTVGRMKWASTDIIRSQIQSGDITGAKLTMEKFIVGYNNSVGLKEYKKSIPTTEEHPEYHQNLRMIGAARAQTEELIPLLEWARSQPSQELKVFALLGIAEGLVGIDNTVCCMGEPYEPNPFRS